MRIAEKLFTLSPRLTFEAVIALLFLVWAGCQKIETVAQPRPPASVVVSTPVVMPLVEWDEYVGRLTSVESVQVRARVSGFLKSTSFAEGQFVQAGQVLAIIDQRPFQAEVNRTEAVLQAAEAQLGQAESALKQARAEADRSTIHRDLARKELDRQTELLKQNATSQQDFDVSNAELSQSEADVLVSNSKIESAESAIVAAQAAVAVAKSNLQLAQLNLQYTEVRSPIDGRISSRFVTEGNYISGGTNDGTLITNIVSMDPIHCYFDADEQTYLKYLRLAREGKRQTSREVSNPVYLALADERGTYPHRGHMDFVDNQLNEQTSTIRGRAILPNPDHQLTPGMFARVRLPGSARYDAVLIPDKAIGTDQAEKFVLVVDKEDKVSRVGVKLGPISHGLRIIRSGLTGSERVIVGGLQRAKPGAVVKPTEEKVVVGEEALPDDYQPVPESQWLRPARKAAGNVEIPATQQSTAPQ